MLSVTTASYVTYIMSSVTTASCINMCSMTTSLVTGSCSRWCH